RNDPDRLPSGIRLGDLPGVPTPATDTTPPPADPLAVGSQDAKDDLYCSGVVFGAALEGTSTPTDQALKLNSAYTALAEGGRAKLVAEKAVTESNAITVGNAWAAKARADYKSKALKISVDDCLKRPGAQKPAAGTTPPALQ